MEDARIVYLAPLDQYAVTYTAYSRAGPLVALAMTSDFRSFDRHGAIMSPRRQRRRIFSAAVRRSLGTYPSTGSTDGIRESQYVAVLLARPPQLG